LAARPLPFSQAASAAAPARVLAAFVVFSTAKAARRGYIFLADGLPIGDSPCRAAQETAFKNFSWDARASLLYYSPPRASAALTLSLAFD
jgi:hypothetical protein